VALRLFISVKTSKDDKVMTVEMVLRWKVGWLSESISVPRSGSRYLVGYFHVDAEDKIGEGFGTEIAPAPLLQ
jgi:hypothetical protein